MISEAIYGCAFCGQFKKVSEFSQCPIITNEENKSSDKRNPHMLGKCNTCRTPKRQPLKQRIKEARDVLIGKARAWYT